MRYLTLPQAGGFDLVTVARGYGSAEILKVFLVFERFFFIYFA
jgi:hypothetical protein